MYSLYSWAFIHICTFLGQKKWNFEFGLGCTVPVSTHSWESEVFVAGVAPEEGAEEVLEGSG